MTELEQTTGRRTNDTLLRMPPGMKSKLKYIQKREQQVHLVDVIRDALRAHILKFEDRYGEIKLEEETK